MSSVELDVAPLSASDFEPFGDVLEATVEAALINSGTTRNFADLARIDVSIEGGRPRISIYRSTPMPMPLHIAMLERHPLSSQLFMPMQRAPFLVVVASSGDDVVPDRLRAFVTNGAQGVNYHRGVWHHPVIAMNTETEFMVVDREGPGDNCDEFFFDPATRIIVNVPG